MESHEIQEFIKPYKKQSPFSRLVNILGQSFKRKEKPETKNSKFEEFVSTVNPEDPIYETVQKVALLCDEAITLAKEKLIIESKLQILNAEIQEISYYEKLTTDDIDYLKEMLNRYMSLSKDRVTMRYQISGFDKALERMGPKEEDAKYILANVRDAEKKQRYFKHDLMYLEGEKVALNYERENLLNAQNFIQKFSFVLVSLFGVGALSFTLFGIITRADVFLPLAIMCLMLLGIIPLIFYLKNRINRELVINLKKRHKAIDMFNKKSIVYAHYTKFLSFIYKKYEVGNSENLTKNLKDYTNYKNILTRFDAIGNSLKRTEDQIDFFIKEHNIQNSAATIEGFAKTVNIEDKQRYFWELKKEQKRLEERNKYLEQTHNNIWNDLVLLNEEDKKSKVIDQIIQKYISEVSRLVHTVKFEEDLQDDEIEKK